LQRLAPDNVHHILEDNGRMYFATNQGLSISDTEGSTLLSASFVQGLTGALAKVTVIDNKLYVESSHRLFVSEDRGISFRKIPRPPGLDGVQCTFVDDVHIYYGTLQGLTITDLQGGNARSVKIDENLLGNIVQQVIADNGDIYVLAAAGGIYVSNDRGVSFRRMVASTRIENMEVNHGRICYIASGEGMFVSSDRGDSFELIPETRDLSYKGVMRIMMDENRIYVGTTNGVFVSRDGNPSTQLIIPQERYREDYVPDILVHDGQLFVATSQGLHVSDDDGQHFRTITPRHGLVSDLIRSLAVMGPELVVTSEHGVTFL
jgi:ligand-binding sensor domain-containing protein